MIYHNACITVSEKLPTSKQQQILYDLSVELAINPDDTKIHDIVKLELGTEHLWYKIQDDPMVKMGLFIFSDRPLPTKLKFALEKLGTDTKNKHNIINTVAYSLLKAHSQMGSNITNTHDFVKSMIMREKLYTDPRDQHSGGFFSNDDFSHLEAILKVKR